MHSLCYITDKTHVNSFGGLKGSGLEYKESIDEIASKIEKTWSPFDDYLDRHDNFIFYYQHPSLHCIAKVGKRAKKEGYPLFSVKFSFVEKQILKKVLQELGLPFNEANIKEEEIRG